MMMNRVQEAVVTWTPFLSRKATVKRLKKPEGASHKLMQTGEKTAFFDKKGPRKQTDFYIPPW